MLPQGTQKSLRAPMTDQEHDTGFFRLDEEGREIQRRQLQGLHYEKESDKATSVFAYATSSDRVIIVLSSIAAIIAGSLNPLLTIIYGQLVGVIQAFTNGTASGSELQSQISKYTLYYVYLALGVFTFVYATTVGFYYTGERITRRMRRAYLQAIIRQNMAFFDVLGAGEVTSRITSDMNTIQEGITSKISLSLTAAATFTTAFVIAFAEYWELALILTSVVVAISGAGYIGGKIAVKHNKRSLASYSNGATIAEEAIGSVRHVAAFGIQEKLAHRYHSHLLDAETSGVRSRIAIAIMISLMMAMPYMSYGLSYWQGSRYLVSGNISSGALVTITFAILIGAFTIGRVAPNTQAFVSSIASASMILKTISRQSPQDPLSHEGLVPEHVKGDIVLKGVDLVYPSRDDVMALDDVNITVEATKTTAIVGASGCGKSSIVGLIERFYEPTKGQLLLDGHDIQMLNLRWLRRYISYVGQEPMLFSTTIFENIRLGLKDIDQPPSTEHIKAMVENAAKSANVHEFITSLPKGYQTEVGEKGLQLSGGQRQRIAIARALVSNPKILLLDEATSALDSKSERMVQRALESAARGRTTIVIAHRLSTVRSSDKIVVMTKGRVVEQGHHDELLQTGGFYSRLVNMQQIQQDTNAKQSWLNEEDADGSENEKPSLSVAQQSDIAVDALTTTPTQTIEHPPGEAGQENAGKLSFWGTVSFILNLNSSEKLLLIIGLFCCIIAGLIIPVQSVFLAEVINVLALPASKYDQLRSDINFWCLMFLMISIVAFLAWAGHGICFSYSSEKLTLHARDQTFRTILRQNIAYFDEKEHSAGAMTALLSTSTTDLNAMNGAVSGNILTFTSVLLGGLILSLVIGWKLALVCTATIPFVAASGYLRLKMLALFDSKVRRTHQESATYASEVVTAIRTVASLSLENHVLDYYSGILDRAAAKSLSSILRASALYAASQSLTYLCAALGYWYGGTLIVSHEYSLLQFFICFAALITGSQIAGSVFSYAPDMSKAMHAARDLKALFQRQPSIDTWDTRGSRVDPEKCAGQIQFENVSFRYPTRTDRVVLENFSLSIEPGQHVALVGPSGCGKSTAISLLERFYDASSGCIRVDGQDISTLDVNDYRSMVSLVGQEPTIYQGTIKENIQLGSPDDVSEERIIQACKDANIYDTILSLPDGFSTVVGSRGNMLSGGQKQRIAIARALLRNTKILLLDEATSALDSASEKLVQDALDAATQHRTSVTVAHRLSTIQHADLICVLDQGRLVERGTHAELMAKRGAYSELVELQSLEEWAERVESGGPSATT